MSHAPPFSIALVTDAWFPQVNGVVTTLSHVRAELEARGHEIVVFHPSRFRTLPCPKYPQIRLSVLPARRLAAMLDARQFDAVHIATEGPLGFAARRHCGRRGLAFTTSYHTQFAQYVKRYSGVPESLTYRGLRWFHGGASCTLVPTPSIKQALEQRGFHKLRTWTRGVDSCIFRPYDEPVYREPRPIFLYVGRVAREKNIEAFLEASLPGTKVVVGDGPAAGELRRRYPRVRFVGFKHGEELARHYADADVFVFPSLTDTFGVVLIEAMACGVPVAAYPVTGPIDVIEQGVTGILSEDLAAASLEALKLDRGACRQRALEFSWSRCAEIFLESLACKGQATAVELA